MAEPPAADDNANDQTAAPKFKRPPTIGDRRRPKGNNPELEMIGRLGSQAQEILQLALRVESNNDFQNFQDYLAFRDKLSEFEAFCNVIESHLKEIVGDRRQELEDRFYSLWAMIFRPTLRALLRFFDKINDEQVLPLGGKDMLESELRALQAMRDVLAAPRFAKLSDQEMLNDLTKLEGILERLAERGSSLPDFSNRTLVTRSGTIIPARAAPAQPPEPPAIPAMAAHPATPSSTPAIGEAPNLRAVRELKGLLDYYKRDRTLRQYVDIDTRAVDEIERKLVANPMDPAAVVWMRQICNAWASRLRMDEKDKDMRRVLAMIKSS